MRRLTIAATLFLCLLSIPSHARSGPDSIRVLTSTGYEYVSPRIAKAKAVKPKRQAKARKAKPRKVVRVAGKSFKPSPVVSVHSSAAPWLNEARRHVGTNPTGKRSLWCADFVNLTLKRTGHNGTGTRMARDFTRYGKRLSGPRPGAIAVYARGKNPRNGHVALVESVNGNKVTLISGNCRRKGVCRYTRSVGSAIAYVWPEA